MEYDGKIEELYLDEERPPKPARTEAAKTRQGRKKSWEEMEAAVAPKKLERGDLVEATVAEIQGQAIILDLGTKDEGFVPRAEFGSDDELPEVGEKIQVAVVKVDEQNERIHTSKRRADYERVWGQLYAAHEQGNTVTAMVTERVRGGLRVDVGVVGFVPASQVLVRDVRHLERFVGRTLPLKILEVDRRSNNVILSHKQAVEEERQRRRERTLSRLHEGVVCEGRVVNLTDYGAFIDLGGLDGLLHISEMAWHHVKHPSEVLKKGEIIRVMVLSLEDKGERISLSRREILPDPWKELPSKCRVGETVEVEITRLVSTGAFARPVELELEGFIPLREMSSQRINKPDEVLSVGQKVEAKIVDIQPGARKLTLSTVQATEQQQREEIETYLSVGTRSSINLGEHFGEVLRNAKAELEAVEEESGEPAETEEEAPSAEEQAEEDSAESPAEEPTEEAEESEPEEADDEEIAGDDESSEDEKASEDEA